MKKLLIVLVLALGLSGCAGDLKKSAYLGLSGDASSTAVALSTASGREGNKLLTNNIGTAVAVSVARIGLIESASHMDEPNKTKTLAGISTVNWAVTANNLMVIAGASGPFCIATGVGVGYFVWKSTEDERNFAEICSIEKSVNPNLICTFNPIKD